VWRKLDFPVWSRNKKAINVLKDSYLAENQESSNEQVQIEGDAYRFFFDIKGIIMIEWVPQGQTVNQKYYIEVLIKLRERVRKKRPGLW